RKKVGRGCGGEKKRGKKKTRGFLRGFGGVRRKNGKDTCLKNAQKRKKQSPQQRKEEKTLNYSIVLTE
ncbi:hypothetical protein, partial [Enterococcus faecalis]|uniref:hypothetical protein n=1 Tax=Enterococcus faecalis TaxID=1351 RepID=UPI003D6ACCBA